jgi:hypothetical protein
MDQWLIMKAAPTSGESPLAACWCGIKAGIGQRVLGL